MRETKPREAIISVTLNCNSRCVMCDIWKNKFRNEVKPEFYHRLPRTLREINITGGEPFLRDDLSEIIKVIKETCPKARLLINTNGYLTSQIKKIIPLILKIDSKIAIRVSFDGVGKTHNEIRRLPNFYKKGMASLRYLKSRGIKDLGISFTLMEKNKNDLLKLYRYCRKNNFEFSLTVVSDSPIYFGNGKVILRPKYNQDLVAIFNRLLTLQYGRKKLKSWARAWFNKKLINFIKVKTRALSCSAGEDFFYLDSFGKVYTCHLKPWLLGDLKKQQFRKIYSSKRNRKLRIRVKHCSSCWMVCSARTNIKNNLFKILQEIINDKLSLLVNNKKSII